MRSDTAKHPPRKSNASLYLVSFNRPNCLRQTLESLRRQTLRDWSISLFQDGPRKPGYDQDAKLVEECLSVFRGIFPRGRVFRAETNIGSGLNKLRAYRQAFESDHEEVGFFFEDDLVLHPRYLEQLLILRDTLKPFERFVPYFACYGTIQNVSKVPVLQASADLATMEHFWGYGLFRSHWIQEYQLLRPYWDYLATVEYRKRCHDHIRRLFQEIGFAHEVTGHDGAQTAALCVMRRCALRTQERMAHYIGEVGLHCTGKIYQRWGFGETAINAEAVPIRPFMDTETACSAAAAYPAAMRVLYPSTERIRSTEQRLSVTIRELEETRQRLDEVLRSTCWRVSAPARRLMDRTRYTAAFLKSASKHTATASKTILRTYRRRMGGRQPAAVDPRRYGEPAKGKLRVALGATVLYRALSEKTLDGIGRYSWELLKALSASADVECCASAHGPVKRPAGVLPAVDDIGPFEDQAVAAFLPGGAFGLTEHAIAGRADILHSTDHLIPKLAGLPVVATLHDAIPLSHPQWVDYPMKTLRNALWRRSARWADHIITVSAHSKSEVVQWFGIPEAQVSVTPLAVGEHWFTDSTADERERTRQRYDLPQNFYLFVGTLQPRKNVMGLIEAHRSLPANLRRAHPLVVAGRPGWNCAAELKRLDGGNTEGLRWLKHVPEEDLLPLFHLASTFVLPSLHEGFGLPVLEAFAAGTPVVASNAGAIPEVAGNAAELVDPLDVPGLAQAMQRVAEDNTLADSLRVKGRERAKLFTWHRTAQLTVEVYRKVLKERLKD